MSSTFLHGFFNLRLHTDVVTTCANMLLQQLTLFTLQEPRAFLPHSRLIINNSARFNLKSASLSFAAEMQQLNRWWISATAFTGPFTSADNSEWRWDTSAWSFGHGLRARSFFWCSFVVLACRVAYEDLEMSSYLTHSIARLIARMYVKYDLSGLLIIYFWRLIFKTIHHVLIYLLSYIGI